MVFNFQSLFQNPYQQTNGNFGGYNQLGINPMNFNPMLGGAMPYRTARPWAQQNDTGFGDFMRQEAGLNQNNPSGASMPYYNDLMKNTPRFEQETPMPLTSPLQQPMGNPRGLNFGNAFLRTGQFGQRGLDKIQAAGYSGQDDYLASNPAGQRLNNFYGNMPQNVQSAANSPRGLGGRNAPRTI